MTLSIGVLALQGDFEEHVAVLKRLGVRTVEVRLPADLETVDALIIPGGESTTISRLLRRWALSGPIVNRAIGGMPLWGTCAGAILLAERGDGPEVEGLRLVDMDVQRNAFGRQVNSFEADLDVPALGPEPFHAVFIRAPKIVETGPDVEVLARLEDGSIASIRQANLLATTFHPELTGDMRFHALFLQIASGQRSHRAVSAGTMD